MLYFSRSPTPSTGSSQSAPTLGTSALSAAALKSQQSVNLTPSLSNYYNEKLIGHVLGWQADQLERQVVHLLLVILFFHKMSIRVLKI